MNKRKIVFSLKAKDRLEEIADYLYKETRSKKFVTDYLNQFEKWLELVLGQFPESGKPLPDYGQDIRRIVYQKYSFVYRIHKDTIEILTVYRQNMP